MMPSDDLKPWLRIGVVTPHPLNDTLPYEFYKMAPPGVMLMTAVLEIPDYTSDAVESQLSVLDRRMDSLMKRGAQRIVLSGVPLAMALGRERTVVLLNELERKCGVPADTDLEAIISSISHLGIKRLGIATRWKSQMNERLSEYLAEAGIEVVAIANSGRSMEENASLDDTTGITLAMELSTNLLDARDEVEGVIMPGGRWITIGAVRDLEAKFGRPVITNHTASLWAALRDAGYEKPIAGWGRLLQSLGKEC
jgi:maleate cis-trans isomerase